MTDYLKMYGRKVARFQEGGPMAPADQAPQGAPAGAMSPEAPQQGGAPDLQGMLMQAYETQDPQLALQVVNMIVEEMQAAQGGGAPQGGMPGAKNGMRMPTPVFRRGGTLRV
jgi:hypothetical protein